MLLPIQALSICRGEGFSRLIRSWCAAAVCNKTKRGRFGDALMELDFAAGEIIAGVKAAGAAENTITFFTSGECPEHSDDGATPAEAGLPEL